MEFRRSCALAGESAWNWKQGQDLKKIIYLLSDEVRLKKMEARKLNEAARQALSRKLEARKAQDSQEMERQEDIQRRIEENRDEVEGKIRVLTWRKLDLTYAMGKHELRFNELNEENREKTDLGRKIHAG